jgi:hypothetical protein
MLPADPRGFQTSSKHQNHCRPMRTGSIGTLYVSRIRLSASNPLTAHKNGRRQGEGGTPASAAHMIPTISTSHKAIKAVDRCVITTEMPLDF